MWPPKFRIVFPLAGVPILLTAVAIGAEYAYRINVLRDLAALKETVVAVHPEYRLTKVALLRFGKEAGSIEPSLLEDLMQGIRRRLGCRSRLDYEGDPKDPWMHAYHAVSITVEREKNWRRSDHIFIWSPRELRFVHYYDFCRENSAGSCPWRHDPIRFSAKPRMNP